MNASKFRIFVCRKVDRSQCQFVEDDHFWCGRAEIPRVSRFRGRFWPNLQNSTTLDEIQRRKEARETGGISKSVFISRVRRNKQKQTSLTQSYQRGKQIYSWSLSRLYLRGGCNEIVFQFFRTFRFRSF